MPPSPRRVTDAFPGAALADVQRSAALQERLDVKYVLSLDVFEVLAEQLLGSHRVLEIDGLRAFRYRTTYFDTPDLTAFRDHMQRRRRRFKCRSREYVDSGLCMFEVKLKGARGHTIKHRMAYAREHRDLVSESALAFLRDCTQRSYGRTPEGALTPALAMVFSRVTLVAPEKGERVTCDFDLAFTAADGTGGRLAADRVIVESKSVGGKATADAALRALGVRPEPTCSKYCLGVGLTNPAVNSNPVRPLLRRHFRRAP